MAIDMGPMEAFKEVFGSLQNVNPEKDKDAHK